MSKFLKNLSAKLNYLIEADQQDMTSWKNPDDPDYDRQVAENALYNTLGPLTDNPRWMPEWDGHGDPVPGFVPGGPAPQWSEYEVMIACAGDPKYMNTEGHPKSPRYGDRGGSPMFRMARSVAKQYGRNSWQYLMEVYSNGLVALARYVKPGYDASRSPFIRWLFGTGDDGKGSKILPFIRSAMEAGVGSSQRARNSLSAVSTLMAAKDPAQAQEIMNSIGQKYQTTKSFDKLPGNTYDQFSPRVYKAAADTLQALQSGDQAVIDHNKKQLEELKSQLADELEMIPGAATGIDRAITNKDRDTTKLGIVSADAERGTDSEGATIGATLAGDESSGEVENASEARETVYKILEVAMQLKQLLQKGSVFFEGDVSGNLTITELRYYVRKNGLSTYPGRGNVRKDTTLARDEGAWCAFGEDPELEPIPSGGTWESIWVREGFPQADQQAIAEEMTKEVIEFNKLGIRTKREVKHKANGKIEAMSRTAVDRQLKNATAKVMLAARLVRGDIEEFDESVKDNLRNHGIVLYEDMNSIDKQIFDVGYRAIVRMTARYIVESL